MLARVFGHTLRDDVPNDGDEPRREVLGHAGVDRAVSGAVHDVDELRRVGHRRGVTQCVAQRQELLDRRLCRRRDGSFDALGHGGDQALGDGQHHVVF